MVLIVDFSLLAEKSSHQCSSCAASGRSYFAAIGANDVAPTARESGRDGNRMFRSYSPRSGGNSRKASDKNDGIRSHEYQHCQGQHQTHSLQFQLRSSQESFRRGRLLGLSHRRLGLWQGMG